MADTNSLKVVCLFEAGARLKCSSELVGLAAHLYHRFFRVQPELIHYELYTFAAACLKLAHSFYEIPLKDEDLVLVIHSVVHGPETPIKLESMKLLQKSINVAYRVISINLEFHIDYRATRLITPGTLLKTNREAINTDAMFAGNESSKSDDERDEDEDEWLLAKNSRTAISGQRYLAHYLKAIRMFVDQDNLDLFSKISYVAWTFLADFYWSPCVTQHSTDHIACACLMMAIQVFKPQLDRPKKKTKTLWQLLDKKWNLIFCEDFTNARLEIIMERIVRDYREYERVFEHEFSLHVIDPNDRLYK